MQKIVALLLVFILFTSLPLYTSETSTTEVKDEESENEIRYRAISTNAVRRDLIIAAVIVTGGTVIFALFLSWFSNWWEENYDLSGVN